MKWVLIASGLLLASCSEPTHEVSVKVEADERSEGPVAQTQSVEARVEVDEERAAAVRDALQKD